MFMLFSLNRHDGPLFDSLVDSISLVQSIGHKAVFVFVGDANALSGWSLSLLLIGTGVMLLIFVICRVVSS